MNRLFILPLFLIFYSSSFNIAYSLSPDVFIQSTVNRASEVLSKNLSKEEKMSQLKIIAQDTVDIKGIGFYSLGPKRKTLNDNQLNMYTEL